MTANTTYSAARSGPVSAFSGSLREVTGLALPLLVSFLSFSIMGIVDTLIMGRVGTVEQGAVGLGGAVVWLLASFFAGTISATNTFVARDHGRGAVISLRKHAYAGFALTPLFSLAIWGTVPLFPWLIEAMGTSPLIAPHVETYVSIRLIGAPLLLLEFSVSSFLRGIGNMRAPMCAAIIANLVNAGLCCVFGLGLFGFPEMGAAGAALATLIASCTETGYLVFSFFGPRNARSFQTRAPLWPSFAELAQLLRVGLPIGFAWSFDIIAWTAFAAYASIGAPVDLAAHTIVFQVIPVSCLPAQALVAVATTLVGQYLGAGRSDLATRAANSPIILATSYMALAGLVMVVFREPLLAAFNADPRVIGVGMSIVLLAAIFQPFDAVGMVIAGALRGASDTRFPAAVLGGSGLLVFLPGMYLFGSHLGLGIKGAWVAAVCHVVIVAALLVVRYVRGHWKSSLA